ncbi:hypothetical protein KAR91_17000 [Candidatus Pacearchaeota archaeon]|nr:hypothetical protein [Candidatus Pacearchaeota archaeon]
MIDYATIANVSGAFPNVVSLNSTGPGNLDGTPYIKSVIDDLWGANQALMDAAGLTPDAVTESTTASQRLEALRLVLGYPGECIFWMGDAADPSSLGIRLLPLNGQTILIASYPELVASAYVLDPQNPTASTFFKTSDTPGTIRNVAGPYFVLPDARGSFMRGLDTSGTVDPDGASRDIGNFQTDKIEEHEHLLNLGGSLQTYREAQILNSTEGSPGLHAIATDGTGSFFTIADGETPGKFNDFETRPKNLTGRWCIRY